jgi:hypothetical protein
MMNPHAKKSPSSRTAPLALILAAGLITAQAPPASAQQQQTAASEAARPFTEEWVYRVPYGHREEWWQIFKKYQIAILERQKQLGYVKEFTVWSPGLHTDENARWDYRIIIVRAAFDAPPGQSEGEVARQLFPDQSAFKRDENRRWELTSNHWDLPIHEVKLDAAE